MDYGKSVRNNKDDLFLKTLEFLDGVVSNIVRKPFGSIDDLTLENLRDFLIVVLDGYRNGKISYVTLRNITDGIESFIFEKYGPEYPVFPDVDKRSVSLGVLDYIDGGLLNFLPEDADFFIERLEESNDKPEETNKKMKEYVENLEGLNRYKDGIARGYLTKIAPLTSESLKNQLTSETDILTTTYIDSRSNIHIVSEEPSGKYSISILPPQLQDVKNGN